MLLIGRIDVNIIRLFALVRLLRFVTLMLVNLFRRWLLELPCGSTARVVGNASIATASILTNIILEICLAALDVHLIIGHCALVYGNLITIIDLFTLLVDWWLVALLRALRQVLDMIFLCHWVLIDVQGRYFRLLVSRLVLYVFTFKVLDTVIIVLLFIFNVQVEIVSHYILVVRLWLLLWELDFLNSSVQIIFILFFLRL